jgi:hypothetical protein
MCASLFLAGLGAVAPSYAQGQPTSKPTVPGYEASGEMRRFQRMAEVMRDMSRQMARMEQEMAKGDLAPDMRRQMSQELKQMSAMMRRMSGLVDRPSMKGAEMDKHVEEMRDQMRRIEQQHR